MTHGAIITLKMVTVLVTLSAMPAAYAQLKPSLERPSPAEQARVRAGKRVVAPREAASQGTAPTLSIFQAVPAQLSAPRPPIVGQRQTALTLVPANGPLERVNERIETRVQSRIVNRLDKFGAAPPVLSPFATAADRARIAVTRRP